MFDPILLKKLETPDQIPDHVRSMPHGRFEIVPAAGFAR